MRKTVLFVPLLACAFLAGCGQVQELEEKARVKLFAGIEGSDRQKTSLDSDGYTVNWEKGDAVGVLYSSDGKTYYKAFGLASGAGTPDGLFVGPEDWAGNVLLGAFYPVHQAITLSTIGREYHIEVNLADNQVDRASGQFGKYDLKAACDFQQQGEGIYSVKFRQQVTLLDFGVIPTDEMTGGGEALLSLSLTAPRAIAGDLLLNISDPYAGLLPYNDVTKAVTVTPDSAIVLAKEVKSKVKMFVVPTVQEDDDLQIEIRTTNHIVNVDAKAAKSYLPGKKYSMTLDLPALVAAGKAYVVDMGDRFLMNTSDFGIFDLSDEPDIRPEFVIGDGWQCGGDAACFRMVNWLEKKILWIRHPSSMKVGETVSLEISSYGESPVATGTVSAVVSRINGTICWLKDDTSKKGYIIKVAR